VRERSEISQQAGRWNCRRVHKSTAAAASSLSCWTETTTSCLAGLVSRSNAPPEEERRERSSFLVAAPSLQSSLHASFPPPPPTQPLNQKRQGRSRGFGGEQKPKRRSLQAQPASRLWELLLLLQQLRPLAPALGRRARSSGQEGLSQGGKQQAARGQAVGSCLSLRNLLGAREATQDRQRPPWRPDGPRSRPWRRTG
jgi:hypothetical protein